jgi:hypothetical protein
MMIEAYGKGGLVPWLSENFSAKFLNDLLEQTIELRRDPHEREEELQREEASLWLAENKSSTLLFKNAAGDEKIVDVSSFMWGDDE